MSIVVKHHLSKESFLLACKINEQEDPLVTCDSIHRDDKRLQNLLNLKAFTIGKKDWVETENGGSVAVVYKDDKIGYYNEKNKFIEVATHDLHSYRLDANWLIKSISKELELNELYPVEEIINGIFWRIGTLKAKKQSPVFLMRRTIYADNYKKICAVLQHRFGLEKGVILTTTASSFLKEYETPCKHRIISLRDCLVHDNNNFHIDRNIIEATLEPKEEKKQNGFSSGYRAAYINDVRYTFSKKQAAVIEALDKSSAKILNKNELLAEADSAQQDVHGIFRSSKKGYHPAWNVVIKNDGKGNYWLEY